MAPSMHPNPSGARIPRPDPNAMTFGEHLEDLRRRLILAILGLLPIAIVALVVGIPVLEFLIRPVQQALRASGLPASLQATGPAETFGSYIRVAIALTAIVGAPWVLYQLWLFIAPGLRAGERRITYFLLPLSAGLTFMGMVLLYLYMLPLVLMFFIGFGSGIGRHAPAVAPLPAGIVLPSAPIRGRSPTRPGPVLGQHPLMQLRFCVAADGSNRRIVATEPTRAGHPPAVPGERVHQALTSLSISFIIGFQTPVVVLVLGWAGIIQVATLTRYRRQAVLICAIAGRDPHARRPG